MKKTLIALAVLGAAAGVAHAQTNVTIYGIVDTGFVKKSGFDTEMTENVNNRLGFRGMENLGNGVKATFELERRFDLNDGWAKNDRDWDGLSNVGLKSDTWGAVRLGRVNELTTETIRKFDPFYQYGVASMIYGTQRSRGIDNTVRYDSPNWNGFKFGATYTLGGNTDKASAIGSTLWRAKDAGHGYDNDGYGIMLGYDNGPLSLVGNWSKVADSADSTVWNLGAAYRFGDVKVELLHQQTRDKAAGDLGYSRLNEGRIASNMAAMSAGKRARLNEKYATAEDTNCLTQKQWLLGMEWKLGPGRLNASAQWMEVGLNGSGISDKDIYKYAVGYTYDLSKRTAIYGNVAYTDYDDEYVAGAFGDAEDKVTAVQVGITHRF